MKFIETLIDFIYRYQDITMVEVIDSLVAWLWGL